METSQYRILMSVPLLGNVLPEWNVSLVDTPGFGEDNAKVSRAADAAMSASSACVYITTSGSLGSKTDTDCFKELHRHGNYEYHSIYFKLLAHWQRVMQYLVNFMSSLPCCVLQFKKLI